MHTEARERIASESLVLLALSEIKRPNNWAESVMTRDEELPKFTAGTCYICNKVVNISAQNDTRGEWFTYAGAVRFVHEKCEQEILRGGEQ